MRESSLARVVGRCVAPELMLAALVLGAPACKCESEKPYTPFGVASGLPDASEAPDPKSSAEPAASAAPSFVPRKAELAPGGTRRWNVAGRSIEAPAGRRFEQAVVGDFDGDGESEIIAWLLADQKAPARQPLPGGELWLYAASGPSRSLLPLPTFVPTGPGCKLQTKLEQTGPRSVTLDVRARCEARLIPRSASGALVTLSPLAEEPIVQLLRFAEPAPGESLAFSVISEDRDGDGRDDAWVKVELGAGGKPASAELLWFDRAAGASRDPNEPSRSLARAASREAPRAKLKKSAPEVLERVQTLRRLAASLCAEGGTPRLFDREGAPLRCQNLAAFVDALGAAEINAHLVLGNVLEAFAAHSRDGWYFAPMSQKQRGLVERNLLAAALRRKVTVSPVAATPLVPAGPHRSALSFEPDGALHVETPGGTVRFSADGSPLPNDEDAAVATRALEATDAEGARWLTVALSCDRSEVALALQGAPEIVTPLLSPRPGACTGHRFEVFPKPAVLGFAPGRLEALIAGSKVGQSGALPSAGSPRSSDGRFIVTPTRLGLLLAGEGGTKSELWELPPDAVKPTSLEDCVLSADHQRAACVTGTRGVVVVKAEAGGQ